MVLKRGGFVRLGKKTCFHTGILLGLLSSGEESSMFLQTNGWLSMAYMAYVSGNSEETKGKA
jgi:hypothetical protein